MILRLRGYVCTTTNLHIRTLDVGICLISHYGDVADPIMGFDVAHIRRRSHQERTKSSDPPEPGDAASRDRARHPPPHRRARRVGSACQLPAVNASWTLICCVAAARK
eukprot:6192129-Pleurochrysis_carterae.AAC.2